MAGIKIKLDHRGILEALQSPEVAEAINAKADEVHAIVQAAPEITRNGAATEVVHYTTDRAAAAVDIDDPAGLAIQAKHGTLTKAARAVGLQVKAKK